MEIKNLKKAAERIKKAAADKEKIILYGDNDMDGMGSAIILKETIGNLGGKVHTLYFPDREKEGYGISRQALEFLKDEAPALFITMDCGITSVEETKLAKKIGFEVIILDHHRILAKLPKASIIVDPHQKGDKYLFKGFSATGIVFKLAELMLGENLTPALRGNFLELAALATIADMMPQESENLEIIAKGLQSLKKTARPGLKVFWEIAGTKDTKQLAQKIISACHAGENIDHINEGYFLLTSTSDVKAKALAEKLLEKADLRRQKIQEIAAEIEERIAGKKKASLVFEGEKGWAIINLGPAASIICKDIKKPVFLYSQKEKDSQGAVRAPKGIDSVKAMRHCSGVLLNYGGHPPASGFKIKNENLGRFQECLEKYFRK